MKILYWFSSKKLLLFCLIFVFSACQKLFFEPDKASTDPFQNFDYLWNEVDRKYSYFDLKKVDWKAVREKYRAKLFPTISEDSLFRVLGGMLNELRDDHTNLISHFNIQVYDVSIRNPANFHWRTVEENYLPEKYISSPFIHSFLANKQVGYIRYSSFLNGFSTETMNFVINRYANTKGLILDLRDNGGGSLDNMIQLLSRFVDVKTLVAYNRTRNGAGYNDFGDYEPFYINPSRTRYMKPVMVLVDRGSYSASTFFALATKALPMMVLVGDTTGGGGGLPNGGQLPNGWLYRFSITQISDKDKNIYAETGVPADIPAVFDWTNLKKDEIIERAIEEILK